MLMNQRLLAIIGRRLSAIDDVIPGFQLVARGKLNPQPLPPFQLGASLAAEFVRVAWFADRFGLDPGRADRVLDDWCPTGTKSLKRPPWWPPIPEPEPHPDWTVEFHLGFAAHLSAVSAQVEGTALGESVAKAIERSVAMIESAKT